MFICIYGPHHFNFILKNTYTHIIICIIKNVNLNINSNTLTSFPYSSAGFSSKLFTKLRSEALCVKINIYSTNIKYIKF